MMKLILSSVFVFACGNVALASHGGHGPCAKDVDTLCASVEKGHGRIMKCLHDNKDKVSAECSAHMEKMKEAMKDVHAACEEDVGTHCHDVKPGGGRIMKCMKEHKDQLSETCKAEIEKKKEARKKR